MSKSIESKRNIREKERYVKLVNSAAEGFGTAEHTCDVVKNGFECLHYI